MPARKRLSSELRQLFPSGTVLHTPVTGEYARASWSTRPGELSAVPGGAHIHPGPEERFEVADGVMGYRLGEQRGELRIGEAVTVAPGVLHDSETFANEIVFERPPRAVQRALAVTVAPIARRRGRSVTGDILQAAIVPAARWPHLDDPGTVASL